MSRASQPESLQSAAASPLSWLKLTLLAAGAGALIGSTFAAAVSGLAAYFARQVVTPHPRVEDTDILAVLPDHSTTPPGTLIVFPATKETTAPGTYSLFWNGGQGHARIGEITANHPADGTVTRRVEQVYSGDLDTAVRGALSGLVYGRPREMGLAEEEVHIPTNLGDAPAWIVRPEAPGDVWAIMVHGRGPTRAEALRAVPTARALGLTSLLISYRNDGDAPKAADGKYGLGLTEWNDVEAAIEYALAHGAKSVVLFGWSMGGAIVLQTADRSRYKRSIAALVLDGPVINWVDVLAHQAKLNKLPAMVGKLGQWLLSNPAGRKLTGLTAPLDLKALDWVSRAAELRIPTLILHSSDDDFVPIGPAEALAEKNPELVTLERYTVADHTREWNVDPERWSNDVTRWLRHTLATRRGPARS